ncbi:unnamed protein product [Amoebophrya sp. A120]|nr:unnamed protein product [Amoebophrya sp. A120]|eukprot:GSA120T00002418001.1
MTIGGAGASACAARTFRVLLTTRPCLQPIVVREARNIGAAADAFLQNFAVVHGILPAVPRSAERVSLLLGYRRQVQDLTELKQFLQDLFASQEVREVLRMPPHACFLPGSSGGAGKNSTAATGSKAQKYADLWRPLSGTFFSPAIVHLRPSEQPFATRTEEHGVQAVVGPTDGERTQVFAAAGLRLAGENKDEALFSGRTVTVETSVVNRSNLAHRDRVRSAAEEVLEPKFSGGSAGRECAAFPGTSGSLHVDVVGDEENIVVVSWNPFGVVCPRPYSLAEVSEIGEGSAFARPTTRTSVSVTGSSPSPRRAQQPDDVRVAAPHSTSRGNAASGPAGSSRAQIRSTEERSRSWDLRELSQAKNVVSGLEACSSRPSSKVNFEHLRSPGGVSCTVVDEDEKKDGIGRTYVRPNSVQIIIQNAVERDREDRVRPCHAAACLQAILTDLRAGAPEANSDETARDLTFWDPYCGSGILGVEALCLGFDRVVCSDENRNNVSRAEERLRKLVTFSSEQTERRKGTSGDGHDCDFFNLGNRFRVEHAETGFAVFQAASPVVFDTSDQDTAQSTTGQQTSASIQMLHAPPAAVEPLLSSSREKTVILCRLSQYRGRDEASRGGENAKLAQLACMWASYPWRGCYFLGDGRLRRHFPTADSASLLSFRVGREQQTLWKVHSSCSLPVKAVLQRQTLQNMLDVDPPLLSTDV